MSNVSTKSALGASARVRRGFVRAGLLLGIAAGIATWFFVLHDTGRRLDRLERQERQVTCLTPYVADLKAKNPKGYGNEIIDTARAGCPGHFDRVTAGNVEQGKSRIEEARDLLAAARSYVWAEALFAMLVLWGATAAAGWAISGFFRD